MARTFAWRISGANTKKPALGTLSKAASMVTATIGSLTGQVDSSISGNLVACDLGFAWNKG